MSAGLASLPLGVPVPFTVWASKPSRIDLVLAEPDSQQRIVIPMTRDEGDWWQPAQPLPDFAAGVVDYGFALDGGDADCRPAVSSPAVRGARFVADVRPRSTPLAGPGLDRAAARGRGDL